MIVGSGKSKRSIHHACRFSWLTAPQKSQLVVDLTELGTWKMYPRGSLCREVFSLPRPLGGTDLGSQGLLMSSDMTLAALLVSSSVC